MGLLLFLGIPLATIGAVAALTAIAVRQKQAPVLAVSMLFSASISLAFAAANIVRTVSRGPNEFLICLIGGAIMWAAFVGLHVFITTMSVALLIFCAQASIPKIRKALYSLLLVSLIALSGQIAIWTIVWSVNWFPDG